MFSQNRHFLTPQKRPAAVQCLLRMAADQRWDVSCVPQWAGPPCGIGLVCGRRAGAVSLRSAQRTGHPPPHPNITCYTIKQLSRSTFRQLIMTYSFMCYFSRLEPIAHYKAKNQNTVKGNSSVCTHNERERGGGRERGRERGREAERESQ